MESAGINTADHHGRNFLSLVGFGSKVMAWCGPYPATYDEGKKASRCVCIYVGVVVLTPLDPEI